MKVRELPPPPPAPPPSTIQIDLTREEAAQLLVLCGNISGGLARELALDADGMYRKARALGVDPNGLRRTTDALFHELGKVLER